MSTRIGLRRAHAGLTIIELIMFIVVVSVGIAGILIVLNVTVKESADPIIRKNMLSIAESLLEEIELMPFTYCDPTDANARTAASPAGCATLQESMGPESGQTRLNGANQFNNVNDYDSIVSNAANGLNPIKDVASTTTLPAGYSATVQIVAENLNDIVSTYSPATMEALRIAVTVSHGSDSVTLEGYRARHSPNFLP